MFFETEDYITHELVQYSYRKDMPIIIQTKVFESVVEKFYHTFFIVNKVYMIEGGANGNRRF